MVAEAIATAVAVTAPVVAMIIIMEIGRQLFRDSKLLWGYINSRAFLLNVAFAGALISGLAVVEMGRDKIWKMQNSGKSFEEAMESLENTKAVKEKE